MVERSIQERIEARELARRACLELVGASTMSDEEMDWSHKYHSEVLTCLIS
jgi:hypothetical protein